MKKAFIFDLDGTLLDSMGEWGDIGSVYLESNGVTDIPENLREKIKPMSLTEVSEYFAEIFEINLTPEEICSGIIEMMNDKYRYDIPLKEGVAEFLKKYSDRKMCIATATDADLAKCALKRLGIAENFQFIITSMQVGSSKRFPDIYLKAAEMLGEPVDNCAVFEDSLHAAKTAKNAGFYCVGVYDESSASEAEEMRKCTDIYVGTLSELTDL